MKIAVISFNSKGNSIAQVIKESINADLFAKDQIKGFNLKEIAKALMENYNALIFIASTGIAVRAVAPYLRSKAEDPAVLVIDVFGKHVISLLSGHLGGANELAIEIAELIKAEPIITTATDGMGIEAPDMIAKRNNLVIENPKTAKDISALLVDGRKVAFIDEENKIKAPKGYSDDLEAYKGLVYVTNKDIKTLYLIRKNIVLGIGCKKNYSPEKMKKTVLKALKNYNLDYRSVKAVVTIEIKKEEQAIVELAQNLKAEFKIFTIDDIKKVEHKYKGSDFVEKNVGVRAVCEPCVELYGARLITEKLNCEGMTLCIGEVE
ncbi:CbiG protein [Clostridiales bacterium oral taxon 876 str. F0540]|nr:CbiG protein [Clostridiales bacterium oral taxon 876 str. F0540]